jgi:nicotinic acid mononucleotide adenylyltransferase
MTLIPLKSGKFTFTPFSSRQLTCVDDRLFILRGMSVRYLLPDAVIDYIMKEKLYLEPDHPLE